MNSPSSQRLREVAALFLKLGATAFGGPAAHIAMMHDETVKRRKWLNDQEFLDLVGATNLIPGPNSTEMAIHIGFLRAGWRGLLVGGICFIVPAMLIVLSLAWVYVRFGTTLQAEWLLYGIKPAVISIIVEALWKLGQKAVKGRFTALVGLLVLALYLRGVNEIALLFAGGAIVMLGANIQRLRIRALGGFLLPLGGAGALSQVSIPFSLPVLFHLCMDFSAIIVGNGQIRTLCDEFVQVIESG